MAQARPYYDGHSEAVVLGRGHPACGPVHSVSFEQPQEAVDLYHVRLVVDLVLFRAVVVLCLHWHFFEEHVFVATAVLWAHSYHHHWPTV